MPWFSLEAISGLVALESVWQQMVEKSASAIARKYDCSKPTILRRLALIQAKTGVDPKQLRRLSPHIAKLEDSLNEPRAARPNRWAHLEEGEET